MEPDTPTRPDTTPEERALQFIAAMGAVVGLLLVAGGFGSETSNGALVVLIGQQVLTLAALALVGWLVVSAVRRR